MLHRVLYPQVHENVIKKMKVSMMISSSSERTVIHRACPSLVKELDQ